MNSKQSAVNPTELIHTHSNRSKVTSHIYWAKLEIGFDGAYNKKNEDKERTIVKSIYSRLKQGKPNIKEMKIPESTEKRNSAKKEKF